MVNVTNRNGLIMNVAKCFFLAEKDNKTFHYSLCVFGDSKISTSPSGPSLVRMNKS